VTFQLTEPRSRLQRLSLPGATSGRLQGAIRNGLCRDCSFPEDQYGRRATREDVSAVSDDLAAVGNRVELVIRTGLAIPDPNDEMVLKTAINGRTDAFISLNDRHFRTVAARFRCSVMRPGEAVGVLAKEAGLFLFCSICFVLRVAKRFQITLQAPGFAGRAYPPSMPNQLMGKLDPLLLRKNCH
jgi:hypothetical protein